MRRAAGLRSRVDTALLAVCLLLSLILKASTDSAREGLASLLRRTVLAPMFSLQASAEKWRGALSSYDQLVAQRDSTFLRAMKVPELEAEIARFEDILVLSGKLDWGFIPARVLHDAVEGIPKQVIVAAGADAGVKPLSPVVTVDGLAGIVAAVDKSTSMVRLWTHPDFSTSAMSEDQSAFGIVSPYLGLGAGGYLLQMQNVQFRHELAPGTRIVASGVGGIYPAMMPVGTVVEEIRTENTWARTYLVRPAVRPQDISTVIILDPTRAQAGIRGVWPAANEIEALRKAMSVKGDSIARARYNAEIKGIADSMQAALRAGRGGDAR